MNLNIFIWKENLEFFPHFKRKSFKKQILIFQIVNWCSSLIKHACKWMKILPSSSQNSIFEKCLSKVYDFYKHAYLILCLLQCYAAHKWYKFSKFSTTKRAASDIEDIFSVAFAWLKGKIFKSFSFARWYIVVVVHFRPVKFTGA